MVFACAATAFAQTEETARLHRINEEWKEATYAVALDDAGKAIEADPRNYWSYFMRGDCYFMLRRWDEAIADFQQAGQLRLSWQPAAKLRIWAARVLKGDGAAATQELRAEVEPYLRGRAWGSPKPRPSLAPGSFDKAVTVFENGKQPEQNVKQGDPWHQLIKEYLAGKLSEADFVPPEKPAKPSRKRSRGPYQAAIIQSYETLFYAGMKRLAEGDQTGAERYLRRSASAEGGKESLEGRFAKTEADLLKAGQK